MTELHIERKERSVWPWALLALALVALVVWFLVGRGDAGDDGVADRTAAVATDSLPAAAGDATALPASVVAFVSFAEAPQSASPSHDYTSDGLRRLADGLGAVIERDTVDGVDAQARLGEIRERADAMQRDPTSREHALQAREAFLVVSSLMSRLQEGRDGAAAESVREVTDAASAVQADRPLLEQTTEVRRFFERSANALREMARTS